MKSSGKLIFALAITFFLYPTAQNVLAQDKKMTKLLDYGYYEKAEAYCAKQKGEKQKECYKSWGDYHFKWHRYEEAGQYYEKANDTTGLLKVAEEQYTWGEWSESKTCYEKAYANDPGKLNENEHYLTAKSKAEKAELKAAEEEMKKAIKNAPELIYEDYASRIDFAEFSPDGRYILSGGRVDSKMGNYPIHLWDLETGKMIRSYGGVEERGDEWVLNASFSHDGKYIIAEGRGIKLFNFETGNIVWKKQGIFSTFSISADDQFIATGSENILILLETKSGKTIKTFERSGGKYIESIDFSPDGRYIATCHDKDEKREIRIWDVENGVLYRTLAGHLKEVARVVFSPDSKHVLSGSFDNTLRLWDVESGQEIRTYRDEVSAREFGFAPDGKSIWYIDLSFPTACFPLQIINIDIKTDEKSITKKFLKTLDGPGDFSFSPNGKFLLMNFGKSIKLIEIETDNELPWMISFDNYNDWLLTTHDGLFDGSQGAMEKIYYKFSDNYLPLESFYERYFTPNLFSRQIEGEDFLIRGNFSNLKLPPTLRINTNISGGLMSQQKNIEIAINATDQGGGIDEIRLYQNNKLINSKKIVGEDKNLITNVTLVSDQGGKNYFRAVALSIDRTESNPEKLTITYTGSKDSKPDLYLLAVGINEYKNPKYTLNYAHADAKAISEELDKGNETLFVNKHICFIENDQATKANILNAFEQIRSQILEQDVFIFYYAGHGMLSEGSLEDKDYYLIMHDVVNMFGDNETLANKAISTSELKELSQNLNAQKQIFLMDACQSGGAVELLAQRGVVEEKAIAQLARSTGTFWIAASESEQFATEFQALGHGVFTYSILEGLSGKADAGEDGIITIKELSMFLEQAVPKLSALFKGEQQYPLSYGYGQDFPLRLNKN